MTTILTDMKLIHAIADRAVAYYERIDVKVKPQFIQHQLLLVHEEVAQLRLQALLDADDFNFMHDISGIRRHLVIGKPCRFADGFFPRYAVPSRRVAVS